ncbi:DUF6801 domain-containing protein [Amycolatopsis sp. H20-H5]|uniref:DUF6801 domain-containing protein n=1 Tax=Amycolatopsis sp. H20-H5 TaxID=3046309 RepID=UPI002DB8F82F|nr:DUF6801 domain-containing protein [Amycolatopsis sp. H20-H5]MEC3982462.1 DUF6801 domain-containing protein [Amycolatopsis sp. H20-H5]
MSRRQFRLFSAAVTAAAALTAVTAGTAAAGGAQTAGAVAKNLTFSCEFPLIGSNQVTAAVAATFPDSVATGSPISVTDFSVGVNLNEDIVSALQLIGAATVEGSAAANVDVNYNDTELGVTLNGLAFPSTPVPASGGMAITITGPVPGLTVKKPGTVKFAVGSAFTGKITPRQADGTPTDLGTFDLPCTMDAGQDPALATVTIN